MKFSEIVKQTVVLLQESQRITYRALKLEFDLTDEQLAALKDELIEARELAQDKDGKMLVWRGEEAASPAPASSSSQTPVSYTPPHLADRIRAEQAALEARGSVDGERKTITALFADLKGSTALIEGLDPEEARAIIDPALQLMMDAVHRYDGYVAQALGDGIFALFGAPLAHEDHPQRALYAALRMQEELHRYADTLRRKGSPPLLMRVGLNTGEVVMRSIRKDDLHADYVPVGHSTNIAARMEALATPGTIVVSEQTHKLTEGYFTFKALGAAQVKGVSELITIYEVLGVGPLRTKLQVAARRGLARFIGRQRELEALQHALEQAKAGQGQIAGVMGEPGVGKSRLFYEFTVRVQSGCLLLETFSVSHGKAYPYLPLIDLLKTYFHLGAQDDDRTRREKLTGKVLTLDRSLEDTLPYLFFLLGMAEPTSPLQQMDLQIRRKRTLEAIKRLLIRESLDQPLLLVFEDLHWLDAETQAFLSLLSDSLATAKILLLVNYRPEYRHDWGNKTYYTQVRLDPLGHAAAEEMLTALLEEKGAEQQAASLRQFILDKTEGNPFFMEEIVQTLAEQGLLGRSDGGGGRAASLPNNLHLPATVQAVLAARIDRLPAAEKAFLQTLAVIGKAFSFSVVKQVTTQPDEELHRLLSHLQTAEFIYEQPVFPEPEYVFKHALTQEVAYNSLLVERRKVLHERVAQAIEMLFPARLEDHYSELASHYSRSGNTQKAVDYLQLAGQQAVQQSAYAEALTQLTTALEICKTLPDTPTHAQQELTLHILLGAALQATKGYAAPEVESVYLRAREICRQLGESPQLFPILWGLWIFSVVRADYNTARELGEQLLRLAQHAQDPALLVKANFSLGETLFLCGELILSRTHLAQSHTFYKSHAHHFVVALSGFEPGIIALSWMAWVLWMLGYPEQALKSNQEAFTLAHELGHPATLAFALTTAATFYQLRHEPLAVQEQAETAIALAAEQGNPTFLANGTIMRGWALSRLGLAQEGMAQIRQGIDAWQRAGAESSQEHFLALLAEAQGEQGQTEEGLATLAEALSLVKKAGSSCFEAELHRLKGKLTLQQQSEGQSTERTVFSPQPPTPSPQMEAEECFLKAIAIARKQQAKSLELRATMSLARLWQQQGRRHEAHNLLSDIYRWFTEGFDTKDLQEAKVLLDELAA